MLVQLTILFFFFMCFASSRIIDINDCHKEKICVTNIDYQAGYREYKLFIYANEFRYDFPNLGIFSEYTNRELYEIINVGDVLQITYIKRQGFFCEYNLLVDVRNESKIYLDFDLYNDQKKNASEGLIVLFLLVEFVFLLIVMSDIIFQIRYERLFLSNSHNLKKHKK